MASRIAYVDGPRLARSLHAASEWVAAGREEINRINVFPVPDGDTGTNFSLTLRAIADALQALGSAPLPQTAQTIARAAVLGARGNSGMMLAHFLMGFAEALGQRSRATAREVASAVRQGADRLGTSIDEPREGTILTVAREAADAAESAAADDPDVGAFMARLLAAGERSLAHTPELLAVLKDAGVVDAGGKGFVRMIEGVVRCIRGDPILPAAREPQDTAQAPAALVDVAGERDYQFCTEVLVDGMDFPPANEVRAALRRFGGSLVVAVTPDLLKAHIHTDTPQEVFTIAERWGTVVSRKAEDMRVQHRLLAHSRRPVAIVADSAVDLPDAVLDRHGITLVPLQVVFGDVTFLDRVELRPEEFYRRLRHSPTLPTTSQPAPADFVRVLREARAHAEEVVVVLVSGALSGTVQAARAVVRAAGFSGVHIFDSKSATLGEGLLALRAAELASEGWTADRILAELERVRARSGTLVTVDRFDNLLRSGRVSRGKAWLAGMLDLKPILALDSEGRVVPVTRVRGRNRLVPTVLSILEERLTPRPAAIRFGVAHAEAPDVAERLRTALVAAYRPRDCFVSLATGVLGTHVGEGAWAVSYQVETPAGGEDER